MMSPARVPVSDSVREELAKFIEVLIEDADLRAWFESFTELSGDQRRAAFQRIAAQMHAAGEHPELIGATALLAEDAIYDGVLRVLSES